jgi:hypothetical protein
MLLKYRWVVRNGNLRSGAASQRGNLLRLLGILDIDGWET